ncbi:hypothetical protein FACS189442_1220 [Spirochaetia bacterium]|nr:hypothetical protein FACS189442_1220 [Spirochaetia bacterium]
MKDCGECKYGDYSPREDGVPEWKCTHPAGRPKTAVEIINCPHYEKKDE